MKKITFLVLFCLALFYPIEAVTGQSGNGHDPNLILTYTPAGYSVPTTMRQDAGFTTFAKNDINNNGGNTDLFVNFTFDTTGRNVFVVYTTDGTKPTKTNGTSVSGTFSNYADPNRTWVVSIPNTANTADTTVEYVFYISFSDLASGNGRITPGGGYQTTWTEGDQIGFRYTVYDSNVAAGGNWSNTATWNSGTVPNSASTNVEIIGTNTVTLDQNAEVENLNLIAGSSLDISVEILNGTPPDDVGYGLTVNNELSNNGYITMESTSEAYSSLIPTTTSGSGTYEYQRFTAKVGSLALGTNDLVSSPVSGLTFGVLESTNGGTLASDGLNEVHAYAQFFNDGGGYENFDLDFDSAEPIVVGKGYRAGTSSAGSGETLTYIGGLTMTDVLYTSITDFGTGSGQFAIWNLVGNPYSSYIKVADFLTQNADKFDSSAAGIYGYDGDASDGWTFYNLANAPDPDDRLIAPGQGFFISYNGTSDLTGENIFTTSMRSIGTTGNYDDFISGRTVQTSFGHVKLKSESTANDYSTEFYFNSNATRGLDPGYDASLFGGSAPEFSIYSHLVEDNQDVPMGIQALGATDFSDVTIPLGIHVTQGEQVTVSMIENTVPSNINVYLEDNVENTFTLLNSGDYIFTPSTTLNTTGRFFLRFSDSALSTEEEQFNGISIYGLTTERIIRVDGLLNQDTELIVYDLQGRKVMSQHLDMNINTQHIDASALHAGVYVVELNNKDQRKTSKIIFK